MNKLITIIIPCYQEAENIYPIYRRIIDVISSITHFDWQLLFVNDGSNDGTFSIIRSLAEKDARVKGLDFSRNFGKEVALSAGVLECVNTDAVICIDADLQHPPELIPSMVALWLNGSEVITTRRLTTENKTFIRRAMSKTFYYLMNMMSSIDFEANTTDFRLYDRKVLDAFRKISGRIYMFRATMDWFGFKTEYVEFHAPDRANGEASYSLAKLINLAISSITSFSLFPLKIVGYLGALIVIITAPLLLWIFINYIFHTDYGYTPIALLVVANTFFMGITLSAIGLVALYIGLIHTETANRPNYIVRDRVG